MNDTLLAAAVAAVALFWGFLLFYLSTRSTELGVAFGVCTPARYESYTAQPAAAPRRIIAELAPPAGWRDVMHVAVVPAPVAQVDDFDGDELDDIDDWDGDGDELPRGVPESVLIALLTGQPLPPPAVVEPEPLPVVVVNRTAARFGALEINRK